MINENSIIVSAISPKYSKADNSTIDSLITFDNGESYPYTAASYDNTSYGKQLWIDLLGGKYGDISPFVSP